MHSEFRTYELVHFRLGRAHRNVRRAESSFGSSKAVPDYPDFTPRAIGLGLGEQRVQVGPDAVVGVKEAAVHPGALRDAAPRQVCDGEVEIINPTLPALRAPERDHNAPPNDVGHVRRLLRLVAFGHTVHRHPPSWRPRCTRSKSSF